MVPPVLRIGFWEPIYDAVELVLREGRPCLVCIAGNAGCGKSTLGKLLRRGGMGRIPLRKILVIDDDVASVYVLGVFRRRVKFPSRQKDFLRPFAPFFKGKQLIVFVTAQPTDRLDECDILIEVNCTEDIRLRNLQRRNADADKRISDTAGYRLVKPKARAEFEIENDGEVFALRSG
jgi:energy-coupling factor transporter ATP-binding protein EcfA2